MNYIMCVAFSSVDPDQTDPRGAVPSGSTLFAIYAFLRTSRLLTAIDIKQHLAAVEFRAVLVNTTALMNRSFVSL